MKTAFVLLLFALFGFSSCNQKPAIDQAASEREIEKRVQERLEAERRAEHERQLEDREKQLSAKEKSLEERERDAERARTEATATAEPERSQPVEPPSSAPPPAESYDVFYDALDRDGDWIQTDNYGYVWVPEVVRRDPAWRPYTIGHWAYTDEGWTWISNERFGWAVYHYGRWTRLRGIGWAWVPGEEWAPAWVAWRSSDDFVGWAALPPEATFERDTGIGDWADNRYEISPAQYVFVNIVNFSAPIVNQVIIEPGRNSAIIGRTRNVTRITSDHSRIVNHGPRFDLLRTRTQRPIEQLRIERRGDTRQLATVRGGSLEVSAPIIKKPDRTLKPRRVKERVAEAIVERAPQPNVSAAAPTPTPAPVAVPSPNAQTVRSQQEAQKALRLQQESAQAREADRGKKQQEAVAEQQRLRQEQLKAQQLQQTTRDQDSIKAQQAEQIRRAETLKAQQLRLAEEQKQRDAQNTEAAAKRQADLQKQQEAVAEQQRRLQEQLKAQQLQQAEQIQKAREAAERQQADALKAQQLQQAAQQQNAANTQAAEEKKRLQQQAAEERLRARQEAIEQRKQQVEQVRQAREEAIRQRQSAVAKQPPGSAPERAKGNRAKPADVKQDESPTPVP